jgi:hypothetical protein
MVLVVIRTVMGYDAETILVKPDKLAAVIGCQTVFVKEINVAINSRKIITTAVRTAVEER